MKVQIIRTQTGRTPIVAMVCKDVLDAKRFLKVRYEHHVAMYGKNKINRISKDGKKLTVGIYVYEIDSFKRKNSVHG